MKKYIIFKACLTYGQKPKFRKIIQAENLETLKIEIVKQCILNPFYAIICDENLNILQNEHCFVESSTLKEIYNFTEN